jgi:hypothetical protein
MLSSDIWRRKRQIRWRGQTQRVSHVRNVSSPTSGNQRASGFNRIDTNLRNQPIQHTLVTLRGNEDASGLLPFSVGRRPCWAAFQKLFRMQLDPPT